MSLFLKRLKIDSRASLFRPFFSIFKDLVKLRIFNNFDIKFTNYIKFVNLKFQFKSNLYY